VVEGADGVYTSFMGHIVVIGRKLKKSKERPKPLHARSRHKGSG
jgi:hypothetical protein